MIINKLPGIAIAILLLVLAGCGGNQNYTEETIDGVRLIHNQTPAHGGNSRISLEFVRKIGEIEGDDENFQFYRPTMMVKNSKGNNYVLDAGNFRVQKFDSNWNFVKTFAQEGQGPGEILLSFDMCMDSDDNIYIDDLRNNRLQVFTEDGEYLRTFRIRQWAHGKELLNSNEMITLDLSGVVVEYIANANPEGHLFAVFDLEGNEIRGFGGLESFPGLGPNGYGGAPQGNDVVYTVWDDGNIYLSYTRRNIVRKYAQAGELLFSSDRALDYSLEPVEIEGRFRGEPMLYKDLPQVSTTMAVDGSGRIWVTTYTRQPDYKDREGWLDAELFHIDVFDNEGVWLSRIDCPVYHSVMKIYGDTVYFIDAVGQMCIYEYKIVEK
ncbi:NHL repeat-containing protein [candidate division KSB1 bacterium]